jgi:nucleoside-diphosphate-sugar epimerase
MKYLVTGATGFIGGRLARALIARGHQVAAVVRTPNKAQDLAALGATLYQGDITEKESLRLPMNGVDGVFHVAAWYKIGAKDKSMAETINVGGTRNVLEMMRDLGIPKGVYTSTLAVFSNTEGPIPDEAYRYNGQHISEYDRTKWLAHYEVALPMMAQGLPLVIVMPGLVYGLGDTSALGDAFDNYLRGKLPLIPKATVFAWAHIDDVVEGHLLAMEKGTPGETYIIAGEIKKLTEGFEIAERATGIPAPRIQASTGMVNAMAGIVDMIGKVIPLPEAYTSEGLRVSSASYLGSNAKARRELGYDPRPVDVGLPEYLLEEMKRLGIQAKK